MAVVLRPALTLGEPRFADPQLAALASASGPGAAWQAALSTLGPERAAAAAGGTFAVGLALPDGRTFLAVDRFATHGLCYRIVDGELRFAAQADALSDGTALDPQALFDYLYFHVIPSPRTVHPDVQRLPPAHYALFERGRLTVAPYWVPRFHEPRSGDFGSLREEFLHLLKNAVRQTLDGTRPACFLSGGTDSSTVAGLIGEVSGRPASSYSIGFEAEGYDEMAYASIAARHFGTDHHKYYVTPEDLVRDIPQLAASYDQPFGNSSVLPAYCCALKARQDGVTRLLAGDGGDELFGGNTRYAKQRVFDLYARVPQPLRSGLFEPLAGQPWAQRLPVLRKGASYVQQARIPMPDRLETYNLLLRLQPGEVLAKPFLGRVDVQGPARQQRAVWSDAEAGALINRTLAYDWRYTLAESDLPKVRGACRLAGVSVGFPLLDDALLEFSMRLPPEFKLKGFKLRWFFKQALRGFLPDEILAKKKHGFGLPFGAWVQRHEPLRRLATDSLHGLVERRLVQPRFVDVLMRSLLPEHPGYYGEMVWILMMLEQWLRARAPAWQADA